MAAVLNNTDLLHAFDNNEQIQLARIRGYTVPDIEEHTAQLCALETLRELHARCADVAAYNALTEAEWLEAQQAGVARAKLHPAFDIDVLSEADLLSAASHGGNYFEQGYAELMASVQGADKVFFRRQSITGL